MKMQLNWQGTHVVRQQAHGRSPARLSRSFIQTGRSLYEARSLSKPLVQRMSGLLVCLVRSSLLSQVQLPKLVSLVLSLEKPMTYLCAKIKWCTRKNPLEPYLQKWSGCSHDLTPAEKLVLSSIFPLLPRSQPKSDRRWARRWLWVKQLLKKPQTM